MTCAPMANTVWKLYEIELAGQLRVSLFVLSLNYLEHIAYWANFLKVTLLSSVVGLLLETTLFLRNRGLNRSIAMRYVFKESLVKQYSKILRPINLSAVYFTAI